MTRDGLSTTPGTFIQVRVADWPSRSRAKTNWLSGSHWLRSRVSTKWVRSRSGSLVTRIFYIDAQTGKPVADSPVEIQVAAQDQLPFPVLTPNLTQRSALYAKIFAGSTVSSSGYAKCKDDSDCAAVRAACRAKCSSTVLPTGDNGITFWNCVNDCAELRGCPRV